MSERVIKIWVWEVAGESWAWKARAETQGIGIITAFNRANAIHWAKGDVLTTLRDEARIPDVIRFEVLDEPPPERT